MNHRASLSTLSGVPARCMLLASALSLLACEAAEIEPIFLVGGALSDGGADAARELDAAPSADAADCPATQPAEFSVCDKPNGTQCGFGLNQCQCIENRWQCNACPQAEPAGGGACNTPGAQCAYGPSQCTCAGGAWECGSCPALEPASGASCTPRFLRCFYEDTGCGCVPSSPGSSSATWICCGCPLQQPQNGAQCCARSRCAYGAVQCNCSFTRWQCS